MRYTSSFIERLAAEPSRRLLHSEEATLTGGEILEQSARIARMLEQRGFGTGDVAVVAVEAGAAFLAVVYATMMSGMTLALIDPEMGPENYRAKIAQLKPAAAFVDSRLLLLQEHPLIYGPARRWFQAPHLPWFGGALLVAVGPWMPIVRRHLRLSRWLKRGPPAFLQTTGLPERGGEYAITYTSGTLAEPKGVLHGIDGLQESIRHIACVLGDPDAQRIATHLPHYMLLGISANVPVFVWKHSWPAAKKIRFIEENRITTLFGPPSDFVPLLTFLENDNRHFPNALNLILLGSAPVHPSFLRRLRAVLAPDVRVVCMYGMTENLLVATATLAEKLAFDEGGDLVGRPVDGVEVRLADDGELLLRSPQCYTRYFHGTERPAWHPTGDLARIRNDGAIVLLGRKKDMIIRGNFNLYPALYEPTVCRIAGVEAAVFLGVYDEARADEVVYLVVEPVAGSPLQDEALRRRIAATLREGRLAIDRQALPDKIRLMKLPRSGRSHKVDRNILRQQLGQSK
jgi:acyl-CoA synthetase (AMP-forming)/AMP-acid ligase II